MRFILHLLVFLSYIYKLSCVNVLVDNTNPIRTVPDRFLSITLDSFSQYPDTWNYLNFTFMAPLARAFGNAYFRFGGTYSDLMAFNETQDGPSIQQYPFCIHNTIYGNNCTIITAAQFDAMYNFANSAGWRFIFDLNLMLRNGTNITGANANETNWDPTNAKKLFDYASSKGYSMDWELGNEPEGFKYVYGNNLTLSGEQLARDYGACRNLLNTYDLYKNSLLVGPASGDSRVIQELLDNNGGQYIYAVTAHHYYFDGGGGKAKLSEFLNVTILNSYQGWIHGMEYHSDSNNCSHLWVGETSSASGGGAKNMSDRFIGGFLWLDKLGLSAKYGWEVLMRQAWVGAGGPFSFGNYTILNKNMLPNPDYWLSFLYKKLIGNNVYNVSVDVPDENLRLYAGSSKNTNGFVLYGQHMDNDSITIDIPQLTNKNVAVYLLKEGEDGNLESDLVKVNGQVIQWNTHLPVANIQGNYTNLPITIPGISLFYIVAQQGTVQGCPSGWYKETTVANKCLKLINYTQPWFSANFDCTTYGWNASLLSIDSAFENTEIGTYIKTNSCQQPYIGLYTNGNGWAWSNGNTNTYRNWKSGYPTNDNTQNCVIYDQNSGNWINSDCDSSLCYICQIFV